MKNKVTAIHAKITHNKREIPVKVISNVFFNEVFQANMVTVKTLHENDRPFPEICGNGEWYMNNQRDVFVSTLQEIEPIYQ